MKLLFYIHHPAQFHLLKNIISNLKKKHDVIVLATKKDILEDLLKDYGLDYINVLPNGRKDSKLAIAWGLIKQDFRLFKICLKYKPSLLIGTSTEIAHIGKLLNIDSIFLNEDDVEVVPLVGKLAYPFAKYLLVPDVCSTGKWKKKTVKYPSYHELAYLHPNHFTPKKDVVEKYISLAQPFFIIRFAKLGAHHDTGIKGIGDNLALEIIEILKPYGKIIVTSERQLPEELEIFRVNINPLDMHHVMSYAKIYIGDSQTMAAEAGVLGTPFIRFNDFVGRIGYLNDLENKYNLGYGIKSKDVNELFSKLKILLETQNLQELYQERRKKMLSEKIDYSHFLTEFIENYPDCLRNYRENR